MRAGMAGRRAGVSTLVLSATVSVSMLFASASSAAPSVADGDSPLRRTGFVTVPQVDGRGYTLIASINTLFDTNFRRQSQAFGGAQGAFRVSPLVEAGVGTRVGRQQLFLGGTIGRDYFIDNSNFNRNRYSVGGGANLRVGSSCTGNLGGEFRRRQLLQTDAVALADNVQRDLIAGAAFNCQGPVGIGFGGSAVYNQARNERLERQPFDFDSFTVAPQISYASPVLGIFSLGGSYQEVRYPQRQVATPDGLFRDGLDILSARLGYSRDLGTRLSLNVGASLIDASAQPSSQLLLIPGVGGGIAVIDREGFKGAGFDSALTLRLGQRMTITGSADRSVNGGLNVGALFTVRNSYGLDLDYRLTPALSAGFGGTIFNSNFRGSFASPDEPQRRVSDNNRRVYGQLAYAPGNRMRVVAEVSHQDRESNPSIFSFSSTTALLRLQFTYGRS